MQGLGWTFDTVSREYEKLRPGYVDELYREIFDYVNIDDASNVVEVGIGGGQATLPVLKRGCTLTAVEPGANLAELCRRKFADYPRFALRQGKFEDMDFAPQSCDMVYSASAFHWVPEREGYTKVFAMLKSGGAFARFANHPYRDKGRPALNEDIDRLYRDYYYRFYNDREPKTPVEYTAEQARARADIAKRYGFEDIRCRLFKRTRTFSADEYVALLGTYSDHIAMEEGLRREFFAGIAGAIERHGGEITVYDTIDLQLARRP